MDQTQNATVFLTILRYRWWQVPFAFTAMALFRLPLLFNKSIRFWKLMGSGRNGTFDKTPDLLQWAILVVKNETQTANMNLRELYGFFIDAWVRLFGCEVFTMQLRPIEGHGTWDGQQCFGQLPKQTDYEGQIAVLTRATIRLKRLSHFWKHVEPVAQQMAGSKGFVMSLGIGEIPWIKQATFSVWDSKADMKAFAYQLKDHAEVVRLTRKEDWYSEEMFTRFVVVDVAGTIKGKTLL
jgi:hypothetical protein